MVIPKAHRPDLKQVVMSLVVTGPSSMPLMFEALSGNNSDRTSFHNSIAQFKAFNEAVQSTESFLWVADSALYNEGKLRNTTIRWLTLVPKTLNRVKELIQQSDDKLTWVALDKDYKAVLYEEKEAGEVWALISSEQAYKKELITFNKRLEKAKEKAEKSLKDLGTAVFACEKDALKVGKKWAKTLKYHQVSFTVDAFARYNKRGKPAKNAIPDRIEYKLKGSISDDQVKQVAAQQQLGRFVLATNDIEETGLSAKSMLKAYKEQQNVEQGFRFVKSDEFHLDTIFLKKPSRIDALMMVMALTLMVYNTSEYDMRGEMHQKRLKLPNQKRKQIDSPTLRWVFHLMQGVHSFTLSERKSNITGKSELKEKIIRLFGPIACSIYDVKA